MVFFLTVNRSRIFVSYKEGYGAMPFPTLGGEGGQAQIKLKKTLSRLVQTSYTDMLILPEM